MNIPNEYKISDNRNKKKFSKKTFSGYKKSDVFKIFNKSLLENKLEDALNWSVEIIVSNYINEIWDKLLLFMCNHINIANIKTINYIHKKYKEYTSLIKNNEHSYLRNNQQFRNNICEIVCILCLSEKKKLITLKKPKITEFTLEHVKSRIKKNTINYDLIRLGDPNELKIACNEIFHSFDNYDLPNILYWLSWIIEWEKIVTKKKKNYVCGYRPLQDIDIKYHNNMIWHIWEIIIYKTKQRYSNFVEEIKSLYDIFKYDYKKSKQNKRLPFLVCAIELLFYNGNKNNILIHRYDILVQASININFIYKEKKAYENLSHELEKNDKYKFIYRNNQEHNSSPKNIHNSSPKNIHNSIPKNTKRKKGNISDTSLKKLEYVMNIGKIIRKDNNPKKVIHYSRPSNEIKNIKLI